MKLSAVVLSAGLLAGCGVFSGTGEVPVSEALSPAAKAAQTSINEANVLLQATARVIGQSVVDGIMLKPEAQRQLDRVKAYAVEVDRAQKMLDAGDIMGAKTKAELTAKLVVALHREVAARAREAK